MNLRLFASSNERRSAIEKELQVKLSSVGEAFIDELDKVHCENLIGAVTLPLGVAGPLKINGQYVHREVYIPLATSEGALVASVNRGSKAITENGGVTVRIEEVGTTRGPVFEIENLEQALWFKEWLNDNTNLLKREAESTSSHLKLKKLETRILGRQVYVRFYYDTEDAMGMNMVTIATQKIVEYIEKETNIICLAVAGNFDVDKKPAWLNFISGRGKVGWAEVIISQDQLKDTLKVSAEDMYKMVIRKCWGGSIMSGSLGYNAHFANIVAAFYAATGQDLAHVVEGSQGITNAEVLKNGDFYLSIYMPDIMIGTIGGGTKLETQTEARSIMKVTNSKEIAEVLLGAVLAGELSLLASITEKTLASSHQKLGR